MGFHPFLAPLGEELKELKKKLIKMKNYVNLVLCWIIFIMILFFYSQEKQFAMIQHQLYEHSRIDSMIVSSMEKERFIIHSLVEKNYPRQK